MFFLKSVFLFVVSVCEYISTLKCVDTCLCAHVSLQNCVYVSSSASFLPGHSVV